MKTPQNIIRITEDGWVQLETIDEVQGLGDIDVDVKIIDERINNEKEFLLNILYKYLRSTGTTPKNAVAQVEISRNKLI
jgi:hypothetical protein